jgi:hypothetical protein
VERSDTHRAGHAMMGFASLYPSYRFQYAFAFSRRIAPEVWAGAGGLDIASDETKLIARLTMMV